MAPRPRRRRPALCFPSRGERLPLLRALQRPIETGYRALGRVRPSLAWARWARLARRQGIQRPSFILSFDCDTEADLPVLPAMDGRLRELGINPAYAVPGEILEQAPGLFRQLAGRGSDLLNHGYRLHTRYDPAERSYSSCFSYGMLSPEEVLKDVQAGHRAHQDLLGLAPKGFRTPHFGEYQRPDQLAHLHGHLREMGYRYSSSTAPLYGLRRGPAVRLANGLWEFPLAGCYDHPVSVLDSWGFRFAAGRRVAASQFKRQFLRRLDHLRRSGGGLLNLYVDPSQVHDWPDFFDCMEAAASYAVPGYLSLMARLERGGRAGEGG